MSNEQNFQEQIEQIQKLREEIKLLQSESIAAEEAAKAAAEAAQRHRRDDKKRHWSISADVVSVISLFFFVGGRISALGASSSIPVHFFPHVEKCVECALWRISQEPNYSSIHMLLLITLASQFVAAAKGALDVPNKLERFLARGQLIAVSLNFLFSGMCAAVVGSYPAADKAVNIANIVLPLICIIIMLTRIVVFWLKNEST